MCRLLAYLGQPRPLQDLISDPPHSLVVQSYNPQQMTSGLLNADGFGIAWYDRDRIDTPFSYRSVLPIWNDINLASLQSYVISGCFMSSIRSATPGQGISLDNCPPYSYKKFSCVHNGFIEKFRSHIFRPLRSMLTDEFYRLIYGSTDSEHIFALLMQNHSLGVSLLEAIHQTQKTIIKLSQEHNLRSALNLIVSDGKTLIASRCASAPPVPSLYWLTQESGTMIASEPLWKDDRWQAIAPNTSIVIELNHKPKIIPLH